MQSLKWASLVLSLPAYVGIGGASAACVPDVPSKLLSDVSVLTHPAVKRAFEDVEAALGALYSRSDGATRDGLSFAIVRPVQVEMREQVHASTPSKAYSFNNGTLKTNDTTSKQIASDSIFRVNSVSKNFAVFSALLASNLNLSTSSSLPELTLDTPVRLLLPAFRLLEEDWQDGGRDITLSMLASHSSGLPRETYSTGFNMVLANGKANAETIGAAWAGATPESALEAAAKTKLMFAPGQRAGYSNTGISILASAVVGWVNNATLSKLTWSEYAAKSIFQPLNMTHSFFGAIPKSLVPDISVPGGPNWADLVVGLGYDPASGMWSSANDLTKYLYRVWLAPDPEPYISLYQRRKSLKPMLRLEDGKQLVGPGWEIDLLTVSTSKNPNETTKSEKTYATYGKAGDGGGWHSWIDVVPNLGYGVVVLSQHSGLPQYNRIVPTSVKETAHEILVPAFAEALSTRLEQRFAGIYGNGKDTGLISDHVQGADYNTTTHAHIELQDQILYLRELMINGTSALEGLDRLGWTDTDQSRAFSTPLGVALTPAEGKAENDEFGPGSQAWRMLIPGLEECDWFDFDGYTDVNGWPLGKIVLVETGEGKVQLRYPPFDVVLERVRAA